jgi:hypothetical protein
VFAVFGVGASVMAACSGAESSDLFGGATSSSSSNSASSSSTSASSGGSSSGSTSSGASSSGSTGVVDAGPKTCRRSVPSDCAGTELCKVSTACGDMGVCAPRPPQADNYAPVCGCDGVTYWNETIANGAGISRRADGACAPQTVGTARCGGINGTLCAGFRRCNYDVESSLSCAGAGNRLGTCWGLPDTCPPTQNPTMRRCGGGGGCRGFCEAIKEQQPFYSDTINCP